MYLIKFAVGGLEGPKKGGENGFGTVLRDQSGTRRGVRSEVIEQ